MNNNQKIAFVQALLGRVETELINDINLNRIPDRWESLELKWLISARIVPVFENNSKDTKRRIDYLQDVLENEL